MANWTYTLWETIALLLISIYCFADLPPKDTKLRQIRAAFGPFILAIALLLLGSR